MMRARALPRPPPRARMLRFLLAGLANTAFGYGVYALGLSAGLPPQAALAGQFALGILWNYMLHARLVFGVSGYGRLPPYALAYAVAYGFNAGLLQLLLSAGAGPYAAQALALAPAAALTFVLVSLALGVPPRAAGRRRR
ncbi:GtrA family protein [Leisingera sp. SS27]|uniref:GtrA family protein n=1 Tax=Leisingera sp. SS27 TaxID=2979462 RepID=UPI00232B4F79|nr:GtrA family protein [Leisingera sp. SS27]MDC0660398.1 GtrA family protein [Leisingera sp. SS27]